MSPGSSATGPLGEPSIFIPHVMLLAGFRNPECGLSPDDFTNHGPPASQLIKDIRRQALIIGTPEQTQSSLQAFPKWESLDSCSRIPWEEGPYMQMQVAWRSFVMREGIEGRVLQAAPDLTLMVYLAMEPSAKPISSACCCRSQGAACQLKTQGRQLTRQAASASGLGQGFTVHLSAMYLFDKHPDSQGPLTVAIRTGMP